MPATDLECGDVSPLSSNAIRFASHEFLEAMTARDVSSGKPAQPGVWLPESAVKPDALQNARGVFGVR